MLKSLQIILIVFLMGNSVSFAQDLNNWHGEYYYSETPVKANAGYSMVMEWILSIYEQDGQEMAMITINGQQTEINFEAFARGGDESISIYFNETVAGSVSEGLSSGDLLFTLTKTEKGIVTTWLKMVPRLVETKEKECLNCFVKAE